MVTSFEIPEDLQERVKPLLSGTETVSQFSRKAFEEKIKRMESRDERARREQFARDVDALRPVIIEILRELKISC